MAAAAATPRRSVAYVEDSEDHNREDSFVIVEGSSVCMESSVEYNSESGIPASPSVSTRYIDFPSERRGYLSRRTGVFSYPRKRFYILRDGTLACWKSEADIAGAPQEADTTAGCRISMLATGLGFSLSIAGKDCVLMTESEEDCRQWVEALQKHAAAHMKRTGAAGSPRETSSKLRSSVRQSVSEPGKERFSMRQQMGNLALRAEKKIAGKAITTDFGKKLLREYCVDETFILLDALRELATRDPDAGSKIGLQLENNVLRLAVKAVLLFQHERLKLSDFRRTVAWVDHICLETIRKYNATRRDPHVDPVDPMHDRLVEQVRVLEAELVSKLSGHIKEKNLDALRFVINFFCEPGRVERFLTDPVFAEPMKTIATNLIELYKDKDVK